MVRETRGEEEIKAEEVKAAEVKIGVKVRNGREEWPGTIMTFAQLSEPPHQMTRLE